MSKSIPLRPALRVQRVRIIVRDALHKRADLVLEGLTAKRRLFGDVQGKTVFIN